MAIASTLFNKPLEHQWTFTNGITKRQPAYCLISARHSSWVEDIAANDIIGVGKDHRTVEVKMRLPRASNASRGHKPKQKSNLRGWKAKDPTAYKEDIDSRLMAISVSSQPPEACQQVEEILLESGRKHQLKQAVDKNDDEKRRRLKDLIQRRRLSRREGNKADVVRSSKLIQKEIKAIAKATKTDRVTEILQNFEDLGHIADVRRKGKNDCISSTINKEGNELKDVKGIADVFAEFYESLYKDSNKHEFMLSCDDEVKEVDKITGKEVRAQLKRMKKKKAAYDKGIVSELLNEGSEALVEAIASIFTEILKPKSEVPESWRLSSIRVMFKKGDPKMPGNYRPICIILILYKLFSKIICERVKHTLSKAQSWDQAGFRKGFSCDDHLFTVTMLADKCKEFNLPLWVAAIDFAKAFDSITHASIFAALKAHKVPGVYIDVLARLYEEQKASVYCDCESRKFEIQRGTKQGDPISPLLFNAVLEEVMRKVKAKWAERKYGVDLQPTYHTPLTNLRFADDILLVARTLPQIKQMISDVAIECGKVGLQLHPEKTKILHNGKGYGSKVKNAKINDMSIEVLEVEGSTMYLGRSLSLCDPHETELNQRIKKAWAKFGTYRGELTDKGIPIRLRLKLFHAVVTPTILYGCASWVMTEARKQRLHATQLRMMRTLLGRRRCTNTSAELEPWIEWMKESTAQVRSLMKAHSIPEWSEVVHRRQRKWKAKLEDMDEEKWAKQVFLWLPVGFRKQGRPAKRWLAPDEEEAARKED